MHHTEFYQKLLENVSTSIIILDEALNICYLNSAAEVLLEISKERAKGQAFHLVVTESQPDKDNLARAINTGQPFTKHEIVCKLSSGHKFKADYTVSPAFLSEKPTLIIEFQPRDRLTRISNEEQLLAKQAASKLLMRGLAHEIKNPLGGIRGSAQLLSRELNAPSLQEYTQIIIEEADRLRHLVDQMLGPNKIFNREPVNIHEVLERVRQLIHAEAEKEIHLERDYDPSIPEFIGDKGQLIQAFLNITKNAMQALIEPSNPGFKGTIRFKTRTLRQFTIGHTRHRLVLKITISDNGSGVPESLIHNIFDPMVSGRAEGTGLGLSITQNIIGQHSGLVECLSTQGDTRFIILIPLDTNL